MQYLQPTEIHIYTDVLRIVLEIINAILTYALPQNPEASVPELSKFEAKQIISILILMVTYISTDGVCDPP